MEECIFCKIIKGEIPSVKIYEDSDSLAFLDIQPLTKGHTLVIPKQHAENVFDIEDDKLQKVIGVAKQIAGKIKNSLNADGVNFLQSNGPLAGQVVFHYHMHIIPRYKDDELEVRPIWESKNHAKPSPEELQALAKTINS